MVETEDDISLVDHFVLVSSFIFLIAGEFFTFSMLEKHSAQNIAVFEKCKQRELSDHWKSIKMLFLKKITGWLKKDSFVWK